MAGSKDGTGPVRSSDFDFYSPPVPRHHELPSGQPKLPLPRVQTLLPHEKFDQLMHKSPIPPAIWREMNNYCPNHPILNARSKAHSTLSLPPITPNTWAPRSTNGQTLGKLDNQTAASQQLWIESGQSSTPPCEAETGERPEERRVKRQKIDVPREETIIQPMDEEIVDVSSASLFVDKGSGEEDEPEVPDPRTSRDSKPNRSAPRTSALKNHSPKNGGIEGNRQEPSGLPEISVNGLNDRPASPPTTAKKIPKVQPFEVAIVRPRRQTRATKPALDAQLLEATRPAKVLEKKQESTTITPETTEEINATDAEDLVSRVERTNSVAARRPNKDAVVSKTPPQPKELPKKKRILTGEDEHTNGMHPPDERRSSSRRKSLKVTEAPAKIPETQPLSKTIVQPTRRTRSSLDGKQLDSMDKPRAPGKPVTKPPATGVKAVPELPIKKLRSAKSRPDLKLAPAQETPTQRPPAKKALLKEHQGALPAESISPAQTPSNPPTPAEEKKPKDDDIYTKQLAFCGRLIPDHILASTGSSWESGRRHSRRKTLGADVTPLKKITPQSKSVPAKSNHSAALEKKVADGTPSAAGKKTAAAESVLRSKSLRGENKERDKVSPKGNVQEKKGQVVKAKGKAVKQDMVKGVKEVKAVERDIFDFSDDED